jgi:hypothetical protein
VKKEIGDFRDLHKGEAVWILANGPSLFNTNIPAGAVSIGINAALSHFPSPYWTALDISTLHAGGREGYRPDYVFLPDVDGLYYRLAKNIRIPADHKVKFGWSHNLERVIYPCGASIWFALQLAGYMGGDPVRLVGFDLKGPRPKGHVHEGEPMEENSVCAQLELMGYLRGLLDTGEVELDIQNLSSISRCTALNNADDQVVDGFGEKPL